MFSAHGTPAVALITKADVYFNGSIVWEPPVIYNSMCRIDTKWSAEVEKSSVMKNNISLSLGFPTTSNFAI